MLLISQRIRRATMQGYRCFFLDSEGLIRGVEQFAEADNNKAIAPGYPCSFRASCPYC